MKIDRKSWQTEIIQLTHDTSTHEVLNKFKSKSQNQRAAIINNRVYVFSNLQPTTTVQVIDPLERLIVDLKLIPTTKKDEPPNHPSVCRLNYAIAEVANKVYFYGGVD